MTIVSVESKPQLAAVRVLFMEYANSLGFHLSFQDFESELAELPGRYASPDGSLIMAVDDEQPAGCVAFKKLSDGICEMKRFYVRPAFRGRGIGLDLAQEIVDRARARGYERMRLDTVPAMRSAMKIYESLGFRQTEAYVFNPVSGAMYYELKLT